MKAMTKPLEQEMVEAWRGILFAHARVLRGLEADLLEQHDLPVTWFDVMGRLRQASGQRLRMHELEERSVFTRSGLTRLVDRIEEAGFVSRERTLEDRRGVYVAITQAGINKLDEVWPDHIVSIQKHFGQYLDRKDTEALQAATKKILSAG